MTRWILAALLLALAACNTTPEPMRDPRIERGTALPPPGLTRP